MTLPKPAHAPCRDAPELYFGIFRYLPDGTLLRHRSEVRLPAKELDLLRLLLGSAGQVISADRLRKELWGDVSVTPDSLPRCVSSLRAHLGCRDCIQTVYKRGYRLTLPVQTSPPRIDLAAVIRPELHPMPVERRDPRPLRLPRLAILPLVCGLAVPVSLGTEIADAAILRLSRMRTPVASLLARDSVFALASSGATAHQAGSALGAHLALAGSVTALPVRLRIRVEMVRVADAVQLWIEDFLLPHDAMTEAEAGRRLAHAIRSRGAAFAVPEVEAQDNVASLSLFEQLRLRA